MHAVIEVEQLLQSGMASPLEPWAALLWSGSELLIFVAYIAISAAVWLGLRRLPDLEHRGQANLFAVFIFLGGISQALSIAANWYAFQPLFGGAMLVTGVAVLMAAAVLLRLSSSLVRNPAPERHADVISKLEVTLAERAIARDEISATAAQNAEALRDANTRLAQNVRGSVLRSRNLIQVVSLLTQPGAFLTDRPESFMRDLRGRVNALAIATSTVMEEASGACSDIERVVRRQVEPLLSDPSAALALEGELIEVGVQGAQQIGLVAWELGVRFAQMNKWERERASIAVAWTVSDAETGNGSASRQCTIEWREILKPQYAVSGDLEPHDDLAPITPEPLDSFSEVLLTQIIPRLLDGKGRIDIEASTFIYRLTCPLSSLQGVSAAEFSHLADLQEFVPSPQTALTNPR